MIPNNIILLPDCFISQKPIDTRYHMDAEYCQKQISDKTFPDNSFPLHTAYSPNGVHFAAPSDNPFTERIPIFPLPNAKK